MSNVFTLDSLREEADKQFAPAKIDLGDGSPVTLRNLLRLNEKTREAVLDALKVLNPEDGSDVDAKRLAEAATSVLTLVSEDPKRLLKALDGDLGLIMQVLTSWIEATQLGEAEHSPS